jgi:DNA-binding NtrC family response regulator
VDVRVISATRRDLDREIQAGRFRDDLYFRLAVTRVVLPPLRHRTGDVGFLARHFWQQFGGADRPLPYDALARFEDYTWPGNIRELHNAVMRQLALGDLADSAASGFDARVPGRVTTDPMSEILALRLPLPRARERVVEEFERRYVERVLAEHGGNVPKAAAASGIALRYFQMIRAKRNA